MKERSLIIFTTLSQWAVGMFWILSVLRNRLAGSAADVEAHILWLVGVLMVVGVLVSLLHLGAPVKAWWALANLRSSWLSREILVAVLFTAASLSSAVLRQHPWTSTVIGSAVAWFTALLGLAMIYCMSRAYRLRTVPAWDLWTTPASFLLTTVLLDILGAVAAFATVADAASEPLQYSLRWLVLVALVLLGLERLVFHRWLKRIAAGSEAAAIAWVRITQEQAIVLRMRWTLAVCGVSLAAAAAVLPMATIGRAVAVGVGFSLVLVSEVLGRALFYEARICHSL